MEYWLCGLCAVLILIIAILLVKIAGLRRAVDEIQERFSAGLSEDTNVGIDITSSDKRMRRLASDIDKQLKLLRREHIRYVQGDGELKEAITNISHDLRTPLTAICGYMELLERQEVSEAVRSYLNIIKNRIDALKQLTEELFRYSVVMSVAEYGEREEVVLIEALEECVAGYYGALTERGIVPDIYMPEGRVARRLNRTALSRILGNIMGNALKYSDGDLSITLSSDGTITVRNRSERLDEVTAGRLFDRFYTVENGQNSSGLGLSIAKILTEQMGGSISASIEKKVFTIKLSF